MDLIINQRKVRKIQDTTFSDNDQKIFQSFFNRLINANLITSYAKVTNQYLEENPLVVSVKRQGSTVDDLVLITVILDKDINQTVSPSIHKSNKDKLQHFYHIQFTPLGSQILSGGYWAEHAAAHYIDIALSKFSQLHDNCQYYLYRNVKTYLPSSLDKEIMENDVVVFIKSKTYVIESKRSKRAIDASQNMRHRHFLSNSKDCKYMTVLWDIDYDDIDNAIYSLNNLENSFYELLEHDFSLSLYNSLVRISCMCMITASDGRILFQDSNKELSELTFPKNPLQSGKSITESTIRDINEKTGLLISNLKNCGYVEWWNPINQLREMIILLKANTQISEIKKSNGTKMTWLKLDDIKEHQFSPDMQKILHAFLDDDILECYGIKNTDLQIIR